MADFKFIHAADLHLDSPLKGLTLKSASFAARVAEASRQAFERLIDLAISEQCAFILIAGDVFDGDWKDHRSGLYFARAMRRLHEYGIHVIMILGNHDAENAHMKRLALSPNVTLLSSKRPESFALPALGVTIHGQSFAKRAIMENLAAGYPAPTPQGLNIGLLHTALEGREGHEPYAPCTLQELIGHGYDYWALGHIHQSAILSTAPYVVYAGNLQGRHAREQGEKGAMLVEVKQAKIASVTFKSLESLRFISLSINVSEVTQYTDFIELMRYKISEISERHSASGLILRIILQGETSLHKELVEIGSTLHEECNQISETLRDDLFIEKIILETCPVHLEHKALHLDHSPLISDLTILERFQKQIHETSLEHSNIMQNRLKELLAKTPRNLLSPEEMQALAEEALINARQHALNLVA